MADRTALMTRELDAHEFIPYGRHVDADTITIGTQGLMTMVEIGGFAFETADTRDLNGLHARLNTLWRNIADPRPALYALLIRHRVDCYPGGTSACPFAAALDAKYQTRLKGEALYQNRQVLAWSGCRGRTRSKKRRRCSLACAGRRRRNPKPIQKPSKLCPTPRVWY